ncbi:MAG: hypothetical protein RLO18_23765 [Gimesia chilikensis]
MLAGGVISRAMHVTVPNHTAGRNLLAKGDQTTTFPAGFPLILRRFFIVFIPVRGVSLILNKPEFSSYTRAPVPCKKDTIVPCF